ncbi:MAG: alpha-L-arabinofuranosidase C-terminal domain-containing protein [Terriglobia bacterium]
MSILIPASRLWSQEISTYDRTDSPEARIVVDASQKASWRIPRTVYGTFLENIGDSIQGGLSAELLDNPSLETYEASLEVLEHRFTEPAFRYSSRVGLPLPWLPLWPQQGRRYEPRWGDAANSDRYLCLMGLPGKEVGIRQEVYLPIERELDYRGTLFARSSEGGQSLAVSFRRHADARVVLATASLPVPEDPGWHRLTFRLHVPPRAVTPLDPCDFVVSVHNDSRVSVDEILLYPQDAVDGFNPEVLRAAKALHSPLLRFGGNFTSGYHWEDGIGPAEKRRSMLNPAWGIPEYNLFGTDEFFDLCKLIDAQPQICLNLGSGSVDEARRWVDYCTGGGADSAQGRVRALNGHPAPYDVAVWELGNELDNTDDYGWQTPDGYARRYGEFYDALHGLVQPPSTVFATSADVDVFHDWNGALINQTGVKLSYLTTHFVVGMDEVINRKQERDAIWAADLAVPVGFGRALRPMKQQIDANGVTRDRVKLALTEWLFAAPEGSAFPRWTNLGGALVAAGWMNMLLQNANFVPVSNMTGLLDFAGIHAHRGRVYVTPQYWTLWLYSNFAGDTPVAAHTTAPAYDVHDGVNRVPEIPHVPWLDVVGTLDSHRGDLTLFVVNRDWKNNVQASIRFQNFNPSSTGVASTGSLTIFASSQARDLG